MGGYWLRRTDRIDSELLENRADIGTVARNYRHIVLRCNTIRRDTVLTTGTVDALRK